MAGEYPPHRPGSGLPPVLHPFKVTSISEVNARAWNVKRAGSGSLILLIRKYPDNYLKVKDAGGIGRISRFESGKLSPNFQSDTMSPDSGFYEKPTEDGLYAIP